MKVSGKAGWSYRLTRFVVCGLAGLFLACTPVGPRTGQQFEELTLPTDGGAPGSPASAAAPRKMSSAGPCWILFILIIETQS